jgi:hypothetical protein
MNISIDTIWMIVLQLIAAGSVYGAIRTDIKNIYRDLEHQRDLNKEHNKRITEAHERINDYHRTVHDRRFIPRDPLQ